MGLNPSEYRRQKDGYEGEYRRGSPNLGEHAECSWEGTYPAYNGDNDREADGSTGDVIVSFGHGVEVLGSNEDMQRLNKSVIQQKHHSRGIPRPLFIPKKHLPNVTDIPNLGMSEAEFPEHKGCV